VVALAGHEAASRTAAGGVSVSGLAGLASGADASAPVALAPASVAPGRRRIRRPESLGLDPPQAWQRMF
jgi:hypothetical protein